MVYCLPHEKRCVDAGDETAGAPLESGPASRTNNREALLKLRPALSSSPSGRRA